MVNYFNRVLMRN